MNEHPRRYLYTFKVTITPNWGKRLWKSRKYVSWGKKNKIEETHLTGVKV